MNTYTTEAKRTSHTMPANTRSMNAEQIVAYGQEHMRYNYVAGRAKPANKFTAYMSEVFSTFEDPAHWKNPFYARFPQDAQGRYITEWLKAAIVWYHGAKPIVTPIGVHSRGYAC